MLSEYLLWNNCNNKCKFCWQRLKPQSSKNEKLHAIELAKNDMLALDVPFEDNLVLFVGGELFFKQEDEVKEALIDLFSCLFLQMEQKKINRSYINTNLLYDIEYILIPILNITKEKNILTRLNFTTSGDSYGRFSEKKKEDLFYSNITRLKDLYPDLNILVNLILTKQFCQDVLDRKFSINEYEQEHNVIMNVIPYIKLQNDENTPTRNQVLSTIIKLNEEQPGYLKRAFDNHTTHPIRKLLHYENNKLVNVSCELNPCGHAINFTRCYSDSDHCFACDLKRLYAAEQGM